MEKIEHNISKPKYSNKALRFRRCLKLPKLQIPAPVLHLRTTKISNTCLNDKSEDKTVDETLSTEFQNSVSVDENISQESPEQILEDTDEILPDELFIVRRIRESRNVCRLELVGINKNKKEEEECTEDSQAKGSSSASASPKREREK